MITYIVKEGDTLWQVSKNFQVTLDSILHTNPQIFDPNYILPGTEIYIPEKVKEAPRPPDPPHRQAENNFHFDNRNQEQNSKQKGRPVRGMHPGANQGRSQTMNQGMNQGMNYENNTINPKNVSTDNAPFIYAAKEGETLLELAQRYGIDMRTLERNNLHLSPQIPLKTNETVFIPLPDNPKEHPNNNYNTQGQAQGQRPNNNNPNNRRMRPNARFQNRQRTPNNNYNVCPYCGRKIPPK